MEQQSQMDEELLPRRVVGGMGVLVGLMQWGEDRQGRDLSWERTFSPMGRVWGPAWGLAGDDHHWQLHFDDSGQYPSLVRLTDVAG